MLSLIIGLDPIAPKGTRSLALLVSDGAGFGVVQVDLDSGVRGELRRLPDQVCGTAIAAEFVRRELATMLVIATATQASQLLLVHAVEWAALIAHVPATKVQTLSVGTVAGTVVSAGPFASRAGAQVGTAVTRMRKGSTDQQLALAWADANATCRIAVVGWTPSGQAAVLTTTTADVGFAPPRWPVFRLAAADLQHAESEQLVLGYPASYGGCYDCAALMLFGLDEPVGAAPVLTSVSRYAVANTDGNPWALTDLELAAGLFGSYKGVQVIGGGPTSHGRYVNMTKRIALCGFVPVDPVLGFPPLGVDPAVPVGCRAGATEEKEPLVQLSEESEHGQRRFLAFPSDVTGESVVLGAPRFETVNECCQVLALIQAPPYDTSIIGDKPSITFTKAVDQTSGYSVSSNKTYNLSKDFGANLGLGDLSLSQSIHNWYGEAFDTMRDSSAVCGVQFTTTSVEQDLLLIYGMSYNVWRYPVVKSSKAIVAGEMLVVFPAQPTPSMDVILANTTSYGYRPRSEVGMLLSYVDVKLDGWRDKNELFNSQIGISVSHEKAGMQITYNQTNMTGDTVGKQYVVANSITNNAHFTASTEFFEYLPMNFGLNLSESETFSDQKAETTHVTRSEHLSLNVSSGYVTDQIYTYQIHPHIYLHDPLGFLVVAWEVTLPGRNWHMNQDVDANLRRFNDSDICLIRTSPFTKDLHTQWFSRSIAFVERPAGTTDIVVEVFNNSICSAGEVVCEFFLGKPALEHQKDRPAKLVPPQGTAAQVRTLPALQAHERATITLPDQHLAVPSYVTVRVSCKDNPPFVNKTYWAKYPAHRLGEE